jgi:hypothetical protein
MDRPTSQSNQRACETKDGARWMRVKLDATLGHSRSLARLESTRSHLPAVPLHSLICLY